MEEGDAGAIFDLNAQAETVAENPLSFAGLWWKLKDPTTGEEGL